MVVRNPLEHHLSMKALALLFAHEIKYICMNTSPNVLETLRLLRFIGIDIFFNQIHVTLYHGVTQGHNSEIQNAVYFKRKMSWNSKLEKKRKKIF